MDTFVRKNNDVRKIESLNCSLLMYTFGFRTWLNFHRHIKSNNNHDNQTNFYDLMFREKILYA